MVQRRIANTMLTHLWLDLKGYLMLEDVDLVKYVVKYDADNLVQTEIKK